MHLQTNLGLVDNTIISSFGFTCTEISQRKNTCIEDLNHKSEHSNIEKVIRFLDILCMSKHIKNKWFKREREARFQPLSLAYNQDFPFYNEHMHM